MFHRLSEEEQVSVLLEFAAHVLGSEGIALLQPLIDERASGTDFVFTRNEQLFSRIGHERFLAFLRDRRTAIHNAQVSTNAYGEFLFVTTSRPNQERRETLTFFGLGLHEPRDRWFVDEWSWYSSADGWKQDQRLNKEQVLWTIEERRAGIQVDAAGHQQSREGALFEMLAELSDDDGALADLEDGMFDGLL
ncbi:MAG: hypothetical protein L6Q98_24565 [Anaerolineae bacterium]|nr:hypothetical protein [Anaerolineae bacterium]NUQ06921.1 hypothetical protein [Anaerolineae bacterium]